MDIIGLIAGIVSLFALIVFFFMASNVSEIRKTINAVETRRHKIQYWRCLETADKEGAYQELLAIFYLDFDTALSTNKKKVYQDLIGIYEKHFANVGHQVPAFPGEFKASEPYPFA